MPALIFPSGRAHVNRMLIWRRPTAFSEACTCSDGIKNLVNETEEIVDDLIRFARSQVLARCLRCCPLWCCSVFKLLVFRIFQIDRFYFFDRWRQPFRLFHLLKYYNKVSTMRNIGWDELLIPIMRDQFHYYEMVHSIYITNNKLIQEII